MTPIFIGYFPKRTLKRPDWPQCQGVEEICSVSCCISQAPPGWFEHWRHNECWAFDTRELAWSVVPALEQSEFELYSYKMFPIRFEHGQRVAIELPAVDAEPLPDAFARLGYDAVSRCYSAAFECSPLSCNGLAEDHLVNRHCLVDTETVGLDLATECSISEPEPGPYYLLEVWRTWIVQPIIESIHIRG